MSSQEVTVTYHIRNSNLSDSLASTEITVKRSWTGTGYESLASLAARYVPAEGAQWITATEGDSAVVFRASDLESIEFVVKEE